MNILIDITIRIVLIEQEFIHYQRQKLNKCNNYKKHIKKIKIIKNNVKKDVIHYFKILIHVVDIYFLKVISLFNIFLLFTSYDYSF
jgi:hypothetical protein